MASLSVRTRVGVGLTPVLLPVEQALAEAAREAEDQQGGDADNKQEGQDKAAQQLPFLNNRQAWDDEADRHQFNQALGGLLHCGEGDES